MSTGQTTQLKSRGQLSNNKGIKLEASNRKLTETRRGLAEEGGPAENWAGVGKRTPRGEAGLCHGAGGPRPKAQGRELRTPLPGSARIPQVIFSRWG